jgi:hypothetical protein
MALDKLERVKVRNNQTGIYTTVHFYKAQDANYLRRNNLSVVDPRLTGQEPIAPPTPKKTAEQQVKELQAEMGIAQSVEVAANNDGIEVIETPRVAMTPLSEYDVKTLKTIADERGIKYAKTAGKAQMLKLLK